MVNINGYRAMTILKYVQFLTVWPLKYADLMPRWVLITWRCDNQTNEDSTGCCPKWEVTK